jgi:hypothetical protein
MNEPSQPKTTKVLDTPKVTINVPARWDSTTLFGRRDHWSLRLTVHVCNKLVEVVKTPTFGVVLTAFAWYLWRQ